MKKLTLSIGLVAAMLSTKAQDTTCTYFEDKTVYEFDYYVDTILYARHNKNKYYDIKIKHGDVLCLHLSDKKNCVRKVIAIFSDGDSREYILNSKNNVYYSLKGTIKMSVGKPKLIIKN